MKEWEGDRGGDKKEGGGGEREEGKEGVLVSVLWITSI